MNLIITILKDENLHEVHSMIEADHECSDLKLKETFEHLHQGKILYVVLHARLLTLFAGCSTFVLLCTTPNTGLSMTGKTRLDKERLTQCQAEMVLSHTPDTGAIVVL